MQHEQYTATKKERKFWKDICALLMPLIGTKKKKLCGLILLKANLNDRVTQREKNLLIITKQKLNAQENS